MNDSTTRRSKLPPGNDADALAGALCEGNLRAASSAAIFQRGQTYARSGAVEIIRDEPGDTPAVYATITGTQAYSTEVWVSEGEVGGACDCPNAADGWFCKHQVALAIVWRERLAGEEPAIDEQARKVVQATVKRAQTTRDRAQALKDFLHAQPAAALADRLLGLAGHDRELMRELQQWRKLSETPRQPADLKALVTEIMSPGHAFISWRESGAYVHRAQAVVPLMAQARAEDPATAAPLCLHAMRRGWAVLQQADDSDGEIGGLICALGAEWVQALNASAPQPAAFGDTYLQVLLDDPLGCFDTAAAERAMGAPALARYRQVLATRWRAAKDAAEAARAERLALETQAAASRKRLPPAPREDSISSPLRTLERMHLGQLEAAGEVDAALAVLREGLPGAGTCQQITELLERHGRFREAFANAEQACKAHPGEHRLQDDLLRCYERDGWTSEALALRRQRFAEQPSAAHYLAVLKAGAAARLDATALRSELQAELLAIEAQAMARSAARPPLFAYAGHSAAGQRDVSLRAEVLCAEGRFDEALALVRPPAFCREGVLAFMARRLGPAQQAARAELLLRVFDTEMARAKSPYRRALELVDEIAALLPAARRAEWLGQLRLTYKAKKNFVRDVPLY